MVTAGDRRMTLEGIKWLTMSVGNNRFQGNKVYVN